MAQTSVNGRFELAGFTASPALIRWGDATQLSVSVRNTSGAAINSIRIALVAWYMDIDGLAVMGPIVQVYGDDANMTPKAISWPNNGVKTFTGSVTFATPPYTSPPDLSGHGLRPGADPVTRGLEVWFYRGGTTDPVWDRLEDISGGYTCPAVVDEYWSPYARLSVGRCMADGTPSDEGERLSVTARLGTGEAADTSAMACRLYYEAGGPATAASAYVDLTPSIDTLLSGVTDDTALAARTFSNGSDWSFMLWFGDAYESAAAAASVSRAFANLHLSGAPTGGAAFGRFSSSTPGHPKLESEYPAYFYGGIEGVTNYASGEVATGGHWIDGRPIYRQVITGSTTQRGDVVIGSVPATLETVVDFRGTFTNSSNTGVRSIPFISYANLSQAVSATISRANNTVTLLMGSNAGATTAGAAINYIVIIEYTKSS